MSSQPPTPERQSQPQQPQVVERALSAGTIVSLVAAALLLVFMLQNRQDTKVNFLFWHAKLPLWFVVLGSALVGAVVWLGFGVLRRHRRRKSRRESRRD
jgi:uncharacterized integral membrane protein